MVQYIFPALVIVVIVSVLVAGCTAPASAPVTVKETTTTVAPAPGPVLVTTASTPAPVMANETSVTTVPTNEHVQATPAATPEPQPTSPGTVTTTNESSPAAQIYYGTLAISMDREKYGLINFEDIGYTYLNPGEKYIVRITSDHNIFAYVIRTADVPRLNTDGGIPVYESVTRTYDYGQLSPIMKLEDIYEDGAGFTVKDFGKYSLVLDTRLSQKDYHFNNEVDKVTVRILKEN
jgi:hypothetical protein